MDFCLFSIDDFFRMYLLITYRKRKSLADIIDQTEIMANGDLDRLIEVNTNNDMKIWQII